MAIDIILIVIGAILMIAGIVGCIVPFIPGIPLCYGGIIALQLTSWGNFSTKFLIIWFVVVTVVQLLDYYVPIWGTKKLGGGKMGAWGSAIGMIAGMFFPPWGIILFPFVGAVVGELLDNKEPRVAIRAGFGAFVGFLAGTLMKLIVAVILSFYFFREVFRFVYQAF